MKQLKRRLRKRLTGQC
uniref:Uncharacterized protein n=1 Tax=Arundo donax TaxID=35708 RepID=A0A0A8Z9Q1_ARUDO